MIITIKMMITIIAIILITVYLVWDVTVADTLANSNLMSTSITAGSCCLSQRR